jgi:hypothetical protein
MESINVDASSPRVRPWIRKLAIFVMPVLFAMCAVAVWDYVEIHRLSREMDAIRAKGEAITATSLIDPAYGEADNAEYRYAAAGLLSLPWSDRDSLAGAPRKGVEQPMQTYSRFTPVREWLAGAAPRPPLDDMPALTKSVLAEWADALSLVDKAASLPYRGPAPGGEYSYRVVSIWNLIRLLSARTIGLSVTGEGDAAVDSAISSIRLRRALRPGQRWMPAVASEVPAVLSLSRPSDAALSRLQAVLADADDVDAGTRDFIEMRARIIDEVWRRWYRLAPGAQLPAAFPQELLPLTGWRPLKTHAFVRILRAWSELLEIARKPWPERLSKGTDALARYSTQTDSERSLGGIGVSFVAASFYLSFRPDLLVYDRSSRIAVAIEQYRRAHADALPAALSELVPQYLDSVPEDPLTGKPLRYHATPDAYIVYSVGPDGNDDGGMLLRQTPPSAAVKFAPGADIGVRVLIRGR